MTQTFLDLIGFDNSKYPDNFNLTFIDNKKYSGFSCTVVLAAKGYPTNPEKDFYLDLSDIKETDPKLVITNLKNEILELL